MDLPPILYIQDGRIQNAPSLERAHVAALFPVPPILTLFLPFRKSTPYQPSTIVLATFKEYLPSSKDGSAVLTGVQLLTCFPANPKPSDLR